MLLFRWTSSRGFFFYFAVDLPGILSSIYSQPAAVGSPKATHEQLMPRNIDDFFRKTKIKNRRSNSQN